MTHLRARPRHIAHHRLAAVLAAVLIPAAVLAQEPPDPQLESAIAALRNIDPAKLSAVEKSAKNAEMDKAWSVIIAAGPRGIARLKQEIATIDRGETKDDFFKLDAAHLLWRTARFDECRTVAAIWTGARLDAQYDYVFEAAIDAAKSQDPRVLPMLAAVLHDDQGDKYVVQHALHIRWPLTHVFIWEAFGPQGLPALLDVLKAARNPVETQSAVILLARAQYIEALPAIRQVAANAEGRPRCYAVEALGAYGHPVDYEFLLRGLRSPDQPQRAAHVHALGMYGDGRAVPVLIEYAQTKDDPAREAVLEALMSLLTGDSLEALHGLALNSPSEDERRRCKAFVEDVLSALALDWASYAAKPRMDRETLLRQADPQEKTFRPQDGDRTLTHEQLLEAAKDWQERHRITDGPWEWVESRHALAAATPADVDLLLRVRASLYWRLSDECLYEADILNELIQRLGRSRYRKCAGLCPMVEPVEAPPQPG